MTEFSSWLALPESIKAPLRELEQFVGDVDGKMICTSTDDNSVIDEGTVDAEDAVKAVNALTAEIERLQKAKCGALLVADERSKENVGLRAEIERLRAAMGDLINATRTTASGVKGDDIIISARAFGALYTAYMGDADEMALGDEQTPGQT